MIAYLRHFITLLAALALAAGAAAGGEEEPIRPRAPGYVDDLTYVSPVDGSAQPFRVYFPLDYAKARPAPYPVVIYLHGFGGRYNYAVTAGMRAAADAWALPGGETGCILAFADGRGSVNYDHLGESDVLNVRQELIDNYNADPRRIYLQGYSMGGHGVYRIAQRFPHLFAAASADAGWTDLNEYYPHWYQQYSQPRLPDEAAAGGLSDLVYFQNWSQKTTDETAVMPGYLDPGHRPLLLHNAAVPQAENGLALPFRARYGGADTTNPPINALQMLEYWTLYGHDDLLPLPHGGGHTPEALENAYSFFASRSADPWPLGIVYRTWLLRHNQAYWAKIDDFRARQQQARLAVAASDNRLTVSADNVESFTLDPAPGPAVNLNTVTVEVNGEEVWFGAWEAPLTLRTKRDGAGFPAGWAAGPDPSPPAPWKTRDGEGPIADALMRPFVVIYGTVGEGSGDPDLEAQVATNRECARQFCGLWNGMMILRWGGEAVVADWWIPGDDGSGNPVYPYATGTGMDYRDAIQPLSDAEAAGMDLTGLNLVVFGDPDTSAYINTIRGASPLGLHTRAEGSGVSIGKRNYPGDNVNYVFVYPRPDDDGTLVVVSRGFLSSTPGLNWDAFSLAKDFEMLSWLYPDYVVYDQDLVATVNDRVDAGNWLYLPEAYLESGFFTAGWQTDNLPPAVRARFTGVPDPDTPDTFLGAGEFVVEAADGRGESGVALVEYNLDGAGWTPYDGPVPFAGPGPAKLEYRATDNGSSYVYAPDAGSGNIRAVAGALANTSGTGSLAVTVSGDPITFVEARLAADQTGVPPRQYTQVAFDQEVHDLAGEFDPGTGVFTAGADGVYLVQLSVGLDDLDTDERLVLVVNLNGVPCSSSLWHGDRPDLVTVGTTTVLMELAAGDTLTGWIFHDAGDGPQAVRAMPYTGLIVARVPAAGLVHATLAAPQAGLEPLSYTPLALDLELSDPDGEFDPGTGVFTAGQSGLYLVQFSAEVDDLDYNERLVPSIWRNGLLAASSVWHADRRDTVVLGTALELLYLNEGDILECRVFHNAADGNQTTRNFPWVFFKAARLTDEALVSAAPAGDQAGVAAWVFTPVALGQEIADPRGEFDPATGVFTAGNDGVYFCLQRTALDDLDARERLTAAFFRDGAAAESTVWHSDGADLKLLGETAALYRLAAGAELDCRVFHNAADGDQKVTRFPNTAFKVLRLFPVGP